jgi:hypothetical protein
MTQTITNSRLCKYCNQVQIYWNNSKGTFVEVETGNKHFCQSAGASASARKPTPYTANVNKPSTQQYRPTFTTGTGKPLMQKQPTKNSIQVLKGSELEVQKQYEKLSDIVAELGGRIHGSQSHYLDNGLELRIVVYYEVPGASAENSRELVKQRLNYYSSESD